MPIFPFKLLKLPHPNRPFIWTTIVSQMDLTEELNEGKQFLTPAYQSANENKLDQTPGSPQVMFEARMVKIYIQIGTGVREQTELI